MAEGLEERKVEKNDANEEVEAAEAPAPGKRRRVRRNEAAAEAPAAEAAEAPAAEAPAAE